MSGTSIGIAALIIAGVSNAGFALPMKYTRKWAWENTWLVWTLFALVVLPLSVALISIPHLTTVYRSASLDTIAEVCGFGAGWGVAQVFFGLAVDMIGITLAFSIVLGTSAAIGSLIPMVTLHREHLNSAAGYAVIGANALVLLGVTLCAAAGKMRDGPSARPDSSQQRTTQGLVLAILCGLLASFMNFGIVFGAPLAQVARSFGADSFNATNAIWMPLLVSGAVPNIAYCAWLMKRNSSAGKYREGPSYWMLALIMAVLWFGSTLLYGFAAAQLGLWGPILGWPLFMSLIVITATMLGVLAGEWKNCGSLPIRVQWTGVALLVFAIFILASSSRNLD